MIFALEHALCPQGFDRWCSKHTIERATGAAKILNRTPSMRRLLMLLHVLRRARGLGTWPKHAYATELKAAVAAVRQAATITVKLQRDLKNIESATKDDASPVTVADVAAQCVVIRSLAKLFPDDGFVAEESAAELLERGERRCVEAAAAAAGCTIEELIETVDRRQENAARWWVLDPIDGTKGFLRGAQYCTALALVAPSDGAYDREAVVGVLGCPNLLKDGSLGAEPSDGDGVVVAAARGAGCFSTPLNGEGWTSLTTSPRTDWRDGLLIEGVAASHSDHGASKKAASTLKLQDGPIRLDSQAKHALLAGGHGDLFCRLPRPGYVERVWDFAAAKVVVEEAGGAITDLRGLPIDVGRGVYLDAGVAGIVASGAPALHAEALAAVNAGLGNA